MNTSTSLSLTAWFVRLQYRGLGWFTCRPITLYDHVGLGLNLEGEYVICDIAMAGSIIS